MQARAAIVVFMMTLSAAATARGQDAFNSFYGPWNQLYYGYGLTGEPNRVAFRFTAAVGGEVTGLQVGAFRSSGSATSTVSLFAANGTQVGALLASYPVLLGLSSQAPVASIATPSSGVVLAAGQEYFLALTTGSNTTVGWRTYGQVAGPMAASNGAQPWEYYNDPATYYAGFRVTVPAPASLGLVLGGLACGLRRRRRMWSEGETIRCT